MPFLRIAPPLLSQCTHCTLTHTLRLIPFQPRASRYVIYLTFFFLKPSKHTFQISHNRKAKKTEMAYIVMFPYRLVGCIPPPHVPHTSKNIFLCIKLLFIRCNDNHIIGDA